MLPTWFVIRSHVPLEHGSENSTVTGTGDEEESVQRSSGDRGKEAVVAEAAVTK